MTIDLPLGEWVALDLSTATFSNPSGDQLGQYVDGVITGLDGHFPQCWFDFELDPIREYLVEVTFDPDSSHDSGGRFVLLRDAFPGDEDNPSGSVQIGDGFSNSVTVCTLTIGPGLGNWDDPDQGVPQGYTRLLFQSADDGAVSAIRVMQVGCSTDVTTGNVYQESDPFQGPVWQTTDSESQTDQYGDDGPSGFNDYAGAMLVPYSGQPITGATITIWASGVRTDGLDEPLHMEFDIVAPIDPDDPTSGIPGPDYVHSTPLFDVPVNVGEKIITVDVGSPDWDDFAAALGNSPALELYFDSYGGTVGDPNRLLRVNYVYMTVYHRCGTIQPPLRHYPRSDGLGASSVRRLYPPPPTIQASNRRGPSAIL